MAKNIADALVALGLVESAVTVTFSGVTFATAAVYPYPPKQSDALPTTPAWINSWVLQPRASGASSFRRLSYAVRAQLFIADADVNRGLEAATRMSMDFIDRLDRNVTLRDAGGQPTVTRMQYRGSDPTIGVAERAGRSYQVLDMFVDIQIDGPFVFA